MKILLALLLCLVTVSDAASPAKIKVLFTGNRQGEVVPCGCERNPQGGIVGFQALVDEERLGSDSAVFLVDAGDTFFSAAEIAPTRRAGELRRADLIGNFYAGLSIDFTLPGERDLAFGFAHYRKLLELAGTRALAANLVAADGSYPFQRWGTITRQGLKIAVVGLVAPNDQFRADGFLVESFEETWKELRKEIAKENPALTIVLSHLGLAQDRVLAELGGMQLIVGAHSLDLTQSHEDHAGVRIVQASFQGQTLGVSEWSSLHPGRTELRAIAASIIPDNRSKRLLTAYEAANQRANASDAKAALEKVNDKKPAVQRYVADAFHCKQCHAKQYAWWEKTKHASAYLVLYAKNQHFDPECIGCHSIGYMESGGFEKIARPLVSSTVKDEKGKSPLVEKLMLAVFKKDPKPGKELDSRTEPARYAVLKKAYHEQLQSMKDKSKLEKVFIGVQCEHCHGNRVGHPMDSKVGAKTVSERSCRTCHRPPNAPEFDPKLIKVIGCPKLERG